MSDETPVPAGPAEQRSLEPRTRIAEYKLDAISTLAHHGASAKEISDRTGVNADYVRKLLKGGHNSKFDDIHEGYRKRILNYAVQSKMQMYALSTHIWGAIERALVQDENLGMAKDTAFEMMDRLGLGTQRQADTNLNIGFQNIHVEQETFKAMGTIGDKFGALLDAIQTQPTGTHELVGDEALPSFSVGEEVPVTEMEDADFSEPEAPGDEPDTPA